MKSKSQIKRHAAQQPDLFQAEQKRETIPGIRWALDELYAVNRNAAAFLRGYISGLRYLVKDEKN